MAESSGQWHHEPYSKSIEKYGDGSKKNPPKGWTFESVWQAESVAKELNALEDRARLAERYAEALRDIADGNAERWQWKDDDPVMAIHQWVKVSEELIAI